MPEPVTKLRDDKSTATTRISVLENQMIGISHNIEKLEGKVESQYSTLHSRISSLRDDLRDDIDAKHDKLLSKLEEHNVSSSTKLSSIEEKMSHIEKWRWMIMGAAIVVGYVLAHIKLENLF